MVDWHHVVKNDNRKLLSHSLDHNTATAQRGKRYGSLPIVLEIKISQCNGYISHPKIFAHYFYFVVFCYHYKSYTYSHIYISLKVSYKQQFHQTIIPLWQRYDPDEYRQTYHMNQTKRKTTKHPGRNSEYVMVYTLFEFDEKSEGVLHTAFDVFLDISCIHSKFYDVLGICLVI